MPYGRSMTTARGRITLSPVVSKIFERCVNKCPWAVYCEGPPSFIWRGGEGQNWGTLSRGFGLRSFSPEISAWGVFVGRRFRPGPKSPAGNSAFSREGRGGVGMGWEGREGGGEGGGLTGSLWPTQTRRLETQVELRCRTCQLFLCRDDF